MDGVVLVLDRSGSMGWSSKSDDREVCGNGIDDDRDGSVDESDCAETRLSFLQASARAWLQLAETAGIHAGIVTFEDTAELAEDLRPLGGMATTGLTDAVDNLRLGNNTAIGEGLRRTISAFEDYEARIDTSLNKAAFLFSDGKNNRGEEPDAVIPDVRVAGIRVYTLSTGEASDDDTLADVASSSRGSHVDSRDITELVVATAQQWASYRNAGVLIPRMPYRVDARNVNLPSDPKKARGGDDWSVGGEDEDRAPPYPVNDYFRFRVEDGTRQTVLLLAGDMSDMSGFGVRVRLDGPAGSGPDLYDTEAPDPAAAPWIRVVRDPYFVLVELRHPNPGEWLLEVRAATDAGSVQTGNMTVFTDHPKVDLFTSVDRPVLEEGGHPVRLDVLPFFDTPLRDLAVLDANVRRPDGSTVPVLLSDAGDPGSYTATITDTWFRGLYRVQIRVRTGPSTFNDPGEERPAGLPPASLPVPAFERTAVEYFLVRDGKPVCRSGDPKDCDGDGVPEESEENDTDGDGVPDAFDADSDGDEIPDGNEWSQGPLDLDKDGTPDHLDPDADGAGIPDGSDPSISLKEPTHVLEVPDLELTACGKSSRARRASIRLSSEEPVSAFTLGLEWDPAAVEAVDLRPGPGIPAGALADFQVEVVDAGKVLVSLSLEPGTSIPLGVGHAFDGAQNSASCALRFTVGDVTPPRLIVPDPIVVDCPGPNGAVVHYTVTAEDDCGMVEKLNCNPPSGSFFPIGQTLVGCEAVDASGNPETRGFLVIVREGGCDAGFLRGDSNGDGKVDVSDGIRTLGFLFLGGDALPCPEAANAGDSAGLDITDAVFTFSYLFLGGAAPPAPGPEACGPDPTAPSLGPCVYTSCP